MVTDPIADFIIRLKNASDAHKDAVSVPYSSLKEAIAQTLKKSGFIKSVEKKGKDVSKTLEIELLYIGNEPRIHDVARISKPSRRLYQGSKDIRSYKSGYGAYVYSTPKGVLSDSEARAYKVGGEILFRIW
jgi:small subunit ribosomal protein S8